jgi:hypothetical protein
MKNKKKSRLKFDFHTNGETIWFYTGASWRTKSYSVPKDIIEQIVEATREQLREEIRTVLGVSK